jgi:type I restriction enzyme S subunit
LQVGDGQLWIEATAPRRGEGPDAVPPVTFGKLQDVPGDAIKLRIRSVLSEKLAKLADYRSKGIVRVHEPFVVAINGHQLPFGDCPAPVPWVVGAVFPIGDESILIDTETGKAVGSFHQPKPLIRKAKGSPVPLDCFLDPSYAGISALIYSTANPSNPHPRLGSGFTIVHNPLAWAPLQRGMLPCWEEYWLDGESLSWTRRSDEHANTA